MENSGMKNTLQKHYDKLRPEERLSAMIAALGRDDMAEYQTLAKSAPFGKTYRVRDSHGLLEAFEFLAMFHMLTQLGNANVFNLLLYSDGIIPTDDGMHIEIDEALERTVINITESAGAWRAVCKEYNLDPTDALSGLPFVEAMQFVELIAERSGLEMGFNPDTEAAADEYRKVINKIRAEWE